MGSVGDPAQAFSPAKIAETTPPPQPELRRLRISMAKPIFWRNPDEPLAGTLATVPPSHRTTMQLCRADLSISLTLRIGGGPRG